MTAKAMAEIIGRKGSLRVVDDMHVNVEVTDVRSRYGRTDYQIIPEAGSGRTWVESHRVIFGRVTLMSGTA